MQYPIAGHYQMRSCIFIQISAVASASLSLDISSPQFLSTQISQDLEVQGYVTTSPQIVLYPEFYFFRDVESWI